MDFEMEKIIQMRKSVGESISFDDFNEFRNYKQKMKINYFDASKYLELQEDGSYCSTDDGRFLMNLYMEDDKQTSVYVPIHYFLDDQYINCLLNTYSLKKDKVIFVITNPKQKNLNNVYGDDLTGFELKKLIQRLKDLKSYGYKDIVFSDGMSIEKVIEANLKLAEWVEEIKNSRIKGRELTPLEKYIYAYKLVTQFIYNEDYDNGAMARRITSIINNDGEDLKIVCLGYANLLSALCNRLAIPCVVNRLIDSETHEPEHTNVMVFLKDEKYGINGVYMADPCFDCPIPEYKKPNTQIYSLMKLEDAVELYKYYNLDFYEYTNSYFDLNESISKWLKYNSEYYTQEEISKMTSMNISVAYGDISKNTNSDYDKKKYKKADLRVTTLLHPTWLKPHLRERVEADFETLDRYQVMGVDSASV